jgi:hypothetical protein
MGGRVINESPGSVLFKDGVLMLARNVYSIEGIGWSTSGGMSSMRRVRNTRLVEAWNAHHHHRHPHHHIQHWARKSEALLICDDRKVSC